MATDRKRIYKAFGTVLREARTGAALSQESFAFEAGIDRTYVSMLERGIRQPSLTMLFVIAETLKLHPTELIEQTEKRLRTSKKKT